MSKYDKLIKRLLAKPKDFTFDELHILLNHLRYMEHTKGRTSGSRIAFIHETNLHVIRLHKPHPGKILKTYQINEIIEALKKPRGDIASE